MSADQERAQAGEVFEFNKNNRLYGWSSRLLDFTMTFSTLQPSAVSRVDLFQTSKVKLWLYTHRVGLMMLLTIYLAVKFMITLLVRSVKIRLHKRHRTDHLDWLLELVGDPFSSPPLPSLLVYLFLPLMALWTRCYLQLYIGHLQAYECSFARFTLEPEREIRRFDLQATIAVKDAMEAFERRRQQLGYSLRLEHNYQLSRAIHEDLLVTQKQLSQVRKLQHQVQDIRPKTLSPDWHRICCKISVLVVTSILMVDMLMFIVGLNYFAWVGWHGRCSALSLLSPQKYESEETKWPKCRLFDAFSPSDMLMIMETNFSNIVLLATPAATLIALQALQICHQLRLTEEIAERLSGLLLELRSHNPSRRMEDKQKPLSERLSKRLIESLISMRLFEQESRECVTMLAHGTRFAIVCSFLFTSTAFASVRLQSSLDKRISSGQVDAITAASSAIDLQPMRILIFAVWFCVTTQMETVLFACAKIPSRISRVELMSHSLMAELVSVQQSAGNLVHLEWLRSHQSLYPQDDPITSLWRRLTMSRSNHGDQLAVRAFTIKLTFEQVMAMQFYAISAISLLYSYIQ